MKTPQLTNGSNNSFFAPWLSIHSSARRQAHVSRIRSNNFSLLFPPVEAGQGGHPPINPFARAGEDLQLELIAKTVTK